MEKQYIITAKEARELAETSAKVYARVYKLIRDEATEGGQTSLDFIVCGMSEKLIDDISSDLIEHGFTVRPIISATTGSVESLYITW